MSSKPDEEDGSSVPRGDEAATDDAPKPVSGVDIRTLPIGPHEAFVMSRVDGQAHSDRIALETGLSIDMVKEALRHLAELGAITMASVAPKAEQKSGPRGPSVPISSPNAAPDPVIREVVDLPSDYDASELDAPGDLPPERKKDVLDHFYALGRVDHYQLLGVSRDADRKEIKAAYNKKVAFMHPDRYFRRDLGDFAPKMSAVFEAITKAHDVLSRKKTRADYDAHLKSISPAKPRGPSDQSGERRVPDPAQRRSDPIPAGSISSPGIPAQRPPARPAQAEVESGSGEHRTISRPSMTPEERKRAAARRFSSSLAPGAMSSRPPASPSPIPAGSGISQKLAAERIRQRYEAQKIEGTDRVQHYVTQADEAEAAGDLLSAANSLRLAVSLAPEDASLTERLTAAESAAAAKTAPTHIEQAAYHESRGEYAEAAALFEKAFRGRPNDASLAARTAECLVEARGDLKRAAELAKRAVELSPDKASYRITLGRAYGRAGMIRSALAELERAKTLEPSNDTIKRLIKQIRRGDG